MKYTTNDFTADNYKFNSIAGKDNLVSLEDLKDQYNLISEEIITEIGEGLENNDPVEVLDGIVDGYVTLDGLRQKLENLSIDVTEAMYRITQNNLSKFVDDELTANKTQLHYRANGVETAVEYNTTYKKYVIKDAAGKVRKPLGFKSVSLEDLIPASICDGFASRVLS